MSPERAPDKGPTDTFIAVHEREDSALMFSMPDRPVPIHLGANHAGEIRWVDSDDYGAELVFDPDPTGQTGQLQPLPEGELIHIGRDVEALELPETASRQHLAIIAERGVVTVVDTDSRNGTFVEISQSRVMESAPRTPTPEREHGEYASAYSVDSPDHLNHDRMFVDEASEAYGVFDGVSGGFGGEIASRLTTERVQARLAGAPDLASVDEAKRVMTEALLQAHEDIKRQHPTEPRPATTATVARIVPSSAGRRAVIANVGDSRAYRLRGGELECLTLDDRHASPDPDEARRLQDKLDAVTSESDLDEEIRNRFFRRNVLAEAVGWSDAPPNVSTASIRVRSGDRLILTTDGVHDNLTPREIAQAIEQSATQTAAFDLVRAAETRSQSAHIRAKHDDITAVVIEIK